MDQKTAGDKTHSNWQWLRRKWAQEIKVSRMKHVLPCETGWMGASITDKGNNEKRSGFGSRVEGETRLGLLDWR